MSNVFLDRLAAELPAFYALVRTYQQEAGFSDEELVERIGVALEIVSAERGIEA